MTAAELSEQLNLTSIRDHGWHMQVCTIHFVCLVAVIVLQYPLGQSIQEWTK